MAKEKNPYSSTVAFGKHFKYSVADIPHTDFDAMLELQNEVWTLCKKKDSEYGASWCKRGGVGAFFTIWRKVDRLEEQLKKADFNMLDITEDAESTESLDETMKDLANYLYLVLEKRQAARATAKRLMGEIAERSCRAAEGEEEDGTVQAPSDPEDGYADATAIRSEFLKYLASTRLSRNLLPLSADQIETLANQYFQQARENSLNKGIDASTAELWVSAQALARKVPA